MSTEIKKEDVNQPLVDEDWDDYWTDVERFPIEKLIQRYKSRWGYKKFSDRALAYWQKGNLLEIGAGLAYVSRNLAQNSTNDIYALDYNLNICSYARQLTQKENKAITFIQGDIHQMPFADNSFEVVMSTGLLEHFEIPELFELVKEMRRVGCVVIANLPQRHPSWSYCWSLRRRLGSRLDPNQRLYRTDEIYDLFQRVGFQKIDMKTLKFAGMFPYMSIVAVK